MTSLRRPEKDPLRTAGSGLDVAFSLGLHGSHEEQPFYFVAVVGPGETVPLSKVTTDRMDVFELLVSLDTFGNDLQVERIAPAWPKGAAERPESRVSGGHPGW